MYSMGMANQFERSPEIRKPKINPIEALSVSEKLRLEPSLDVIVQLLGVKEPNVAALKTSAMVLNNIKELLNKTDELSSIRDVLRALKKDRKKAREQEL